MKFMRRFLYPSALAILLCVWCTAMQVTGNWHLLRDHWQMSATMVLGSFVAGSTPAGGGAVAFPVFTKVLAVKSSDAALFGLMIQSIGMSMASLFIISRRIPFYGTVYRWAAIGGSISVVPAVLLLKIPAPLPKLLFSCLIFAFGLVLYWMQSTSSNEPGTLADDAPRFSPRQRLHLLLTGMAGGVLASQLGSGADMLSFIVMIVALGLAPKKAIPTTVLTMATISVAGFLAKLALQPGEIGIVWHYWAVSVPVVAIGAPLGAFVLSKLPQQVVVRWVLALIVAEVASTLLVIDLTSGRITFIAATLAVACLWIWFLVHCRKTRTS
ncbi:MAG: sulfite exporter TauE/SafE family protein [Verrucomicrobiae bacterium]|nr:sulfite exporter TauE/SafE family protein [Verrucomicrobiae bacterium]